MDIVIFYQHVNREYSVCRKLKRELENQALVTGQELGEIGIFQIDFEWTRAIRWAKSRAVSAVIMPWLYHDGNYVLVKPFIEMNENVLIVNLHQEQISSRAYESILLPTGECCKRGCIHFAWGDFFSLRLQNIGVPKELIRTPGNMRLDVISNTISANKKKLLGEEYGIDVSKRWILYAENRGWIYKFNDQMLHEYVSQGVDVDAVERNYAVAKESLRLTYEQINSLPNAFFEKFEFVYRPHPGTTTPISNPSIHVISEHPISDWLECADAVIVWDSTSAFEAELAGIPVFRHEPISNPADLRVFGIENYECLESLSSLTVDAISDVTDKQKGKHYYAKYYGVTDGRAVERNASTILGLIKEGIHPTGRLMLDQNLKHLIHRKRIFEAVVSIFSRFNLVEKFHWPRSAYSQLMDVPKR